MSKRNRRRRSGSAPKGPRSGNSRGWRVLLFLAVVVALWVLLKSRDAVSGQVEAIDYTTLYWRVVGKHSTDPENPWLEAPNQVKKLLVRQREAEGEYRQARGEVRRFRLTLPENYSQDYRWQKIMAFGTSAAELEKGYEAIQITHKEPSVWQGILVSWVIPLLLMALIFWFLFVRQIRGGIGPGGVLSFGKSRHTLATKEKTKKTFKDVAGVDEAKQEVHEIIEFLRDPARFQRLGGRIPKGVLLIGAPGTGKTLLAKAIAGEAKVPFFSISGSDFVEMFVGVGASRVRDLFQQAQENAPCIIFLDEIDAVGRRRGTGLGGGHDEREQTLNAILVEMDGFDSDEKVIVMAATNRPDVLDPALLRPGRFDRHIHIDLPDIKGREEILQVHGGRVRLGDDVSLKVLAKGTPGFSGADLENLINEAALAAALRDADHITMADLEEARDKVMLGPEKRSRVMDEEEKWKTAVHESGHALVGYLAPEADKPHKVTIVPRGPTLGQTSFLPEKDVYNHSRRKLLSLLMIAYGGRIAEELVLSEVSTGAKNDIEHASKIARRMVCEWGMSERLGPINYSEEEEHLFLGREVARTRDHSEATAQVIDEEVRALVEQTYNRAKKLLADRKELVEHIAQELMECEILTGEELAAIIEDQAPVRPQTADEEREASAAPETSPRPKKRRAPKAQIDGEEAIQPA